MSHKPNGLTRRDFLKQSAAVGFTLALGSGVALPHADAGIPKPKNVLFLMTDEYNMRAMSCVGHRFAQTPNLDRLARGGVLFENAYCAYPVCTASRASLHTGMWPHRHGSHLNVGDPDADPQKGLSPETVLMASAFYDRGFKTYHHGKWHIGDITRHPCYNWNPRLKGHPQEYAASMVDYNKKHPIPSDLPPGGRTENTKLWCLYGWPLYETPKMREFDNSHPDFYTAGHWAIPSEAHETSFITNQLMEDLSECGKQPYMITWSDYGPHGPHNCPTPYYERIDPTKIELPKNLDRPRCYDKDPSCAAYDDMGEENIREYLRCYYGLIMQIDDQIGRILRELETRGELDDTMIVFTADHGDMCGAHKTAGGKAIWAFYDEVANVPLIIHWPRGIRGGRKVKTLVNGVDVMPTILDYAGLPIPTQCQGESLRKIIDGKEDMSRTAYCEATHPTAQVIRRMIRTQEWKLWFYYDNWTKDKSWREGRPPAMYNIAQDPGEERNLADDPKYAADRKKLIDQLLGWMESNNDPWLKKLPEMK